MRPLLLTLYQHVAGDTLSMCAIITVIAPVRYRNSGAGTMTVLLHIYIMIWPLWQPRTNSYTNEK